MASAAEVSSACGVWQGRLASLPEASTLDDGSEAGGLLAALVGEKRRVLRASADALTKHVGREDLERLVRWTGQRQEWSRHHLMPEADVSEDMHRFASEGEEEEDEAATSSPWSTKAPLILDTVLIE